MKINPMNKQVSEVIFLWWTIGNASIDREVCGIQHPPVPGIVDYQKAFNLAEILPVLESIQHHGVDPTYINILKHIYQNATSFITLHKD